MNLGYIAVAGIDKVTGDSVWRYDEVNTQTRIMQP